MAPLSPPLADAIRAALTLAALPRRWRAAPDIAGKHRIVRNRFGGLDLRRVYTAGGVGPFAVGREEAVDLLGFDDLADRDRFELHLDSLRLHQLLVGLLADGGHVIARAAAAFDLDPAAVRAGLRTLGVDLDERRIHGTEWTVLPKGNSWQSTKVTGDNRGLALDEARLLEPHAELGDEIELPLPEDVLPELCALFDAAEHIPYELDAASFEALVPVARPLPTPAPLERFGLGPLRQMYPEDHGMLFAIVPGEDAERLWIALDAAAPATGFRPVILAGSESNWSWGWSHRLAWRQDHEPLAEGVIGLQSWSHPMTDPATVLAAAATVDVDALLRRGGNPSYPHAAPERGEWPDEDPRRHALRAVVDQSTEEDGTEEPHEKVVLALVPADSAWQALAYLPHLTLGGQATPSLAQATAVCRRWEERFVARLASVDSCTLEWIVSRPPFTRAEALALAEEHFTFTVEGGSEVLEERAAELMGRVWYAYWD